MTDRATNPGSQNLFLETPLIFSPHISSRLECNVYLKLENFQPSQSYKYRGVSFFIQHVLRARGPSVHLVVASSGNAGLATACAAKALCLKCTVFLVEGVNQPTLDFFKLAGAEVKIQGKCYAEASKCAEQAVERDDNAVMVPAYDNPIVWEGHGSMIAEIARQLPAGTKPDAVFCSVGGGGLAGGIMVGCKAVGWDDVPLITLETSGSNCFYESIALNEGIFTKSAPALANNVEALYDETYQVRTARLHELTSRASSLGASSPSPGVVKMALERKGRIQCVCVPDEMAMQTAALFAEDHKMLVELACSTTLIPAYKRALFDKLVLPQYGRLPAERTVVFVVCGGFKIALEEMAEYQEIVKADLGSGTNWNVLCNGEWWNIAKG